MKILIKQAKIIDSSSKHNGKVCDILINNNRIEKISKKIQIDSNTKIYKNTNLHISVHTSYRLFILPSPH